MNSFSCGWSFLKQAWQMAVKDKDLIKPSIYSLFAGFLVSLLFIPLMAGGWFLFGGESSAIGQVVMFILGAVMIFVQYTVGYVFSAMTVYLIYGFLSEGDGRMDKAWAVVKRDFLDLLSLAGASTGVNLLKGFVKGKGKSGVRNALAGLIDTVWTEAAFLILPAMVIENFNLKDSLKRAAMIIKNNLLLVGLSTVGVKAVNGLIGFLLGLLGIGLGVGSAYGIIAITGYESAVGMIGGISLGVIIAGLFIMVATVITSYTSTAYHTCLYLWAREVEKAAAAGSKAEVQAPAPLAAALGGK
jgi:hypothetical protein